MSQDTRQEREATPAEMYQGYFVPGIFERWTPVLLEHAAPRPGERVLDVACGTGIVARGVAPLVGAEGRVVGLDNNPGMLEVAETLPTPDGASIEWREADVLSPPDGPFDLVLCQQGLQFFPDPAGALRAMRRVAAPAGGRVALSVWKGLERHPLYEALIRAEARYLGEPVAALATPFSLGDADALRGLLEDADFSDVTIAGESRTVRFPSPERWVTLTLIASGAVLPEFSEMDEEERAELVETAGREIAPALRTYTEGDEVAFPMHAHIAVATARPA